jgi:hypothetical protein
MHKGPGNPKYEMCLRTTEPLVDTDRPRLPLARALSLLLGTPLENTHRDRAHKLSYGRAEPPSSWLQCVLSLVSWAAPELQTGSNQRAWLGARILSVREGGSRRHENGSDW